MKLLLTALILLLPALIQATEPVLVRLNGGQTSTPDGFRVRITSGPEGISVRPGLSFEMLWYSLDVPKSVGNTQFNGCQLMMQDGHGGTLLSVPLGLRDGKLRDEKRADVMIQRQYMKGCELHFLYTGGPTASVVKEYILFLPNYLPAKR